MKRPWILVLVMLLVPFSTSLPQDEKSSCAALLQRDAALASWSDTRLKWAIHYNHFQSWWSGESFSLSSALVRYFNEALARNIYTVQDAQRLLQQKAIRGNFWPYWSEKQGLVVLTEEERRGQVTSFWQAWAQKSAWPQEVKQALQQFSQSKLMFLEQAELIRAQLPSEIAPGEGDIILSYLNYAYSFPPIKRNAVLRDLHKLLGHKQDKSSSSSPYLKKFWRFQRQLQKYTDRQEKYHSRNLPPWAAHRRAQEDRGRYEELIYGCFSLQRNAIHQKAAQRFKTFYVTSSFLVSTSMYAALNWDKPKDGRWFGIWGYDALTGIIMRYIVAQIRSNPQDLMISKWSKNFLLAAVADVVLSNFFVLFFGETPQLPVVNNDDLMELLDQHLQEGISSNNVQEHLAGERPFTPKLHLSGEELSQLWPLWKEYFEQAVHAGKVILNDESLTTEEQMMVMANMFIEKSLAKNAFGEQLTHKAWIDTGSSGLDRYIYHRLYFIAFGMPTLALSVWMYHILCLGRDHPVQALVKASVLYALDKVIFDYLYFKFRRHAIHQ